MAKGQSKKGKEFSNAYELFILILTVLSLAIMVLVVLPLPEATHKLLLIYDNLICVVFLGDFTLRITRASSARRYFFHERGWLDLLGSIPSLGVFRYAGLFRLARLSRLARIMRLMSGQRKEEIIADVLTHRGEYAGFVTITAAALVLVIASILVLTFEVGAANANITTGGGALWWAIVTMTTVGYGDKFPVTAGGRITAVFVMFMGVGIIGALASILASLLVTPEPPAEEADQGNEALAATAGAVAATAGSGTILMDERAGMPSPELKEELQAIRAELEAVRRLLGAPHAGRPPDAPSLEGSA
jgi:voltage-gated potassium channel